jgi:hypothetical protein
MEKQLILELDRIQNLMGVENKIVLISEQVAALRKLFNFGDEVFQSVEENKKLLQKLNDLVDTKTGIKKLTQKEIDDLAEKLTKQRNSIKAWSSGTVSIEPEAAAKLRQLETKATKSASRSSVDALYNLRINQSLKKVFEREGSVYSEIYKSTIKSVDDGLSEQIRLFDNFETVAIGEKDIIDDFVKLLKENWSNNPKTKNLKIEDYSEFLNWAKKKFVIDGGDMDDLVEDVRYFKIYDENTGYPKDHPRKGQREIDPNKSRKIVNGDDGLIGVTLENKVKKDPIDNTKVRKNAAGIDDEEKLISSKTDIDNLATARKNYRAWRNFYKKIKGLLKGTDFFDNWEKNCALLKGFDPNQIAINGRVNPKFENLVRQLSFDADLIATMEKGTEKLWEELFAELKLAGSDEIISSAGKVDLYGGWGFKSEDLTAHLERQKLRYGNFEESENFKNFLNNIKVYMSGIWGMMIRSKESYLSSAKTLNSRFTSLIKFKDIIIPEIFYSSVFNPKQIGLMFTRRGLTFKGLLISAVETYLVMILWKKFMSIPFAIAAATWDTLVGKFGMKTSEFNKEFDFDENGEPGWTERAAEYFINEWNPQKAKFYVPLDPTKIINMLRFVMKNTWRNKDIDGVTVATEDLEKSYNQKFDELWNNLPGGEKEKEKIIKIQENIYTTSFSQLSQQLLKNRSQIDAYRNKKITDSDCQKLLNARVGNVGINRSELPSDFDIDTLADVTNLKPNEMIKSGGFRDKNYNVYLVQNARSGRVIKGGDYNFIPIPYRPKYTYIPFETTVSEGGNKYYAIYYYPTVNSTGELVNYATIKNKNIVEKNKNDEVIGPGKGNKNEAKFFTEKGVKDAVETLNDGVKLVEGNPVNIVDFVKRLSDKPLPALEPPKQKKD